MTTIPESSIVAGSALDARLLADARVQRSGEWGLLLIPVLVSLAMIIVMAFGA